MGTLWEGLYIYVKDNSDNGFRGYKLLTAFNKRMDADTIDQAHDIVRHTGVSVGSFGRG